WNLCGRSDLLEAAQIVSEESVFCGIGSVAGQSVHHIAVAWPRDHRVPAAARMAVRLTTAFVIALDVRAWSSVSVKTTKRLILAVFGIAAILIAVWAILWIVASKSRD